MMKIEFLEQELAQIKSAIGSKIAECRASAGFGKTSQPYGNKSANLIFNVESGKFFPNKDTLEHFIELYEIMGKDLIILKGLHDRGRDIKKQIIRQKRGWSE
jgi:hypothetical protein